MISPSKPMPLTGALGGPLEMVEQLTPGLSRIMVLAIGKGEGLDCIGVHLYIFELLKTGQKTLHLYFGTVPPGHTLTHTA